MSLVVMLVLVRFIMLKAGVIMFFVAMLITCMFTVLVPFMTVIVRPVATMAMHMALLLTGFFYFADQWFRSVRLRLICPRVTSQAFSGGRHCGVKKIFFQGNVNIRVRKRVKIFRPGHNQHPGARHLCVNGGRPFGQFRT
jgi:hypothetical protein